MEGIELQYLNIVMKKLAQLQPKKRLVICKDQGTAQTRPHIRSISNLKNIELPLLPREPSNGDEMIEKQIKTHQELTESKTRSSLNNQRKENTLIIAERKKSLSNGNFTTQNTIETRKSIRVKNKDVVLEELVNNLMEKVQQRTVNSSIREQFSEQRNCLEEMLVYLIRVLASTNLSQLHVEYSSFKEFKTLMEKIQLHALLLLNQQKKQQLNLHSNILFFATSPIDQHSQHQDIIKEMSDQQQKVSRLKKEIEQLIILRKNSAEHYEKMKERLAQEQKLEKRISSLNERINSLDLEQKEKRAAVLSLEQEAKRIENFVNVQENRQLLKMASQDYRQIEADIYEYAVYLQSNQLASNLNYEPLPFNQLEAQITEQIKQLSSSSPKINGSSPKNREENCLLRTAQFYRKKVLSSLTQDLQMQKLLEFKTKCIRQFVSKMKKWLQNWELKQQFLVNLRKQFASLSKKMTLQIQTISNKQLCQTCDLGFKNNIREITEIFQSIEENYCLGNSFY